ncbi:MAG: aminoglycoside phosphotransferase family protein [Coriobacteriia bacterium]|nr:aminoglycoside phosphotransferase family protein [Coriobacteriia bacterium]
MDEQKRIAEELGAGKVLDAITFGDGHINDTFKITTPEEVFILQKINTEIFKDVDGMMDNICRVTEHLRNKGKRAFKVIGHKSSWRLLSFIENTYSVYVLSNPAQAETAARAFAVFQNDLVDLPGPRLVETITDFHNTPFRFRQLEDAIASDNKNRAKDVKAEIDFIYKHKESASKIVDLMNEGKIPERITHNDTKINNVMLDNDTNEAITVVDLDTVMPGSSLYDFGDMVRTATASAEEDEANLDIVYSKKEYFAALAKGYLSEAKFLNQYEIDNLAFSGWLITYEQAIRFLADYINGDVYYKTNYPDHNLVRTRNQITMAQSIEEQMDEYNEIVRKEIKNG